MVLWAVLHYALPSDMATEYIIRRLFVPARDVPLLMSVQLDALPSILSSFSYFTVTPGPKEVVLGVLQTLAFTTLFVHNWGTVRAALLTALCVLSGPVSSVVLDGNTGQPLMGTDCLVSAFQGAALWIQKPNAQDLLKDQGPVRRTRISSGEVLSVFLGLLLMTAMEAVFSIMFGCFLGYVIRRRG